ncbi:hypothetical protein M8818_000264 [Zalaria obscura]|uniref:Uncharacterized protein n=1 Tax=Zalaria obscura TaxID=2024903 RepID=A0ACC3SPJ9_9PEZI
MTIAVTSPTNSHDDTAIERYGVQHDPRHPTAFQIFVKPIRKLIYHVLHKNKHLSPEEEAKAPWHMLNLPSYGNWTGDAWHVRLHGNVYRPSAPEGKKLDNFVNFCLVRASIKKERFWRKHFTLLNETEAKQARVQAKELATTPIYNASIAASINGLCNESQNRTNTTNVDGDFNTFVHFSQTCAEQAGDSTQQIQFVNITVKPGDHVLDADNQDQYVVRTALVPPHGLTIVSDNDDVLRVAEVWNWKQALLNTFARHYQPIDGMPEILHKWHNSTPGTHFHYISDLPQPLSRFYVTGTDAQ